MTLKTGVMMINSSLPSGINYISKYIQIENSHFKLSNVNISQHYSFYCIFEQINESLVSITKTLNRRT